MPCKISICWLYFSFYYLLFLYLRCILLTILFPLIYQITYQNSHFLIISSSLTCTRMISSPTCFMHLKGITYSVSLPKRPHNFGIPGTIIAIIQPFFISNSTSDTQPNLLQSHWFMTSFSLSSHNLITNPISAFNSDSNNFSLTSVRFSLTCWPAPGIFLSRSPPPSVYCL